jgi:hypothetical protein
MKFQISEKHFWGYNKDIDVTLYDNEQEILKFIVDSLHHDLLFLGLEVLAEKIKFIIFSIPDMNHILNLYVHNNKETIYICDHRHNHNNSSNCC